MHDFFRIVWKWFRWVLLALIIIWLAFFLLNLLSPKFSRYVQDKIILSNYNQDNAVNTDKQPLKVRIYKYFFGGSTDRREDNTTTTTTTNEEDQSTEATTTATTTNTIINFNELPAQADYIFPNTGKKHEILTELKLGDKLYDSNGENVLNNGDTISGKISSNYQSHLSFSIYVYNSDRELLYTIPTDGTFDPNDNYEYLSFATTNYSSYDLGHYNGDGYLAIWTDNPDQVQAIMIAKIKIQD